ncbi:hypothetical protein CJP74_00105 [Psittacicella melopsittaci]|uniref:Porin n=1 Tax=Psittacicella melopsittaci TaxID=2028576 RepID=A0A3A1Y7D6_9GAMM|nr:porin [Psittacicella melopsittaci]RIY34193.1 hypothetical protein CJP74_00105 [Psittacicella melopsittaci]
MKKTLLAASLAVATLFTATSAQAYTLYSDDNTSLRLYGYTYVYHELDREAGYSSSGAKALTSTQVFYLRPQVYFYKKLDDKVSLSTYARFNVYTNWKKTYTRNLDGTSSLDRTTNRYNYFYNNRIWINVRHSDYGSLTVGRNLNFLANNSWAGGYASFLSPYDLAYFTGAIGGFVSDKSVSYSSPKFGQHSFSLAVDQRSSSPATSLNRPVKEFEETVTDSTTNYGIQTTFAAGYNYNVADDGGTLYVYGSYNQTKNSNKVANASTPFNKYAVEAGYYGDVGEKYSHVAYVQYADSIRSYDKTAKNIGVAVAYSGYYSFGKPAAYFTAALTKTSEEASNVKTKNVYAGVVLGTSYNFFTYQSFRLVGYLEYQYQYHKYKTEGASYSGQGTNSGVAALRFFF